MKILKSNLQGQLPCFNAPPLPPNSLIAVKNGPNSAAVTMGIPADLSMGLAAGDSISFSAPNNPQYSSPICRVLSVTAPGDGSTVIVFQVSNVALPDTTPVNLDLNRVSWQKNFLASDFEFPVLVDARTLSLVVKPAVPFILDYLTGTTRHLPSNGDPATVYHKIIALTDTVIDTLEIGPLWSKGQLNNVPLPKGASLEGSFISVTLTSGSVVAYIY